MRIAILFILLFNSPAAVAGRDPHWTDVLPRLGSIEVQERAVSFGAGFRLADGDWAGWTSPSIDNRKHLPQGQRWVANVPGPSCSLPRSVREKYRNDFGEVKILLCEADRTWFASSSYCAEGRELRGHLYSYEFRKAHVLEYPGFIPKCEAFAGLTRVGEQLWAASVWPSEYGAAPGQGVLVFDIASKKRRKVLPGDTFTSSGLLAIAHQPQRGYVWVTTYSGIDRYSLATGKWEHRYLDIAFGGSNQIQFVLVQKKPTEKRRWMTYHVVNYPIDDPAGFARTWDRVVGSGDLENVLPPFRHSELLPYYISALRNMVHDGNEYEFVYLLQHIGSYIEDGGRIRALLAELNRQDLSTLRRGAVVELLPKFQLHGAAESVDSHFEMLRKRFFTQGEGLHELCEFAYKHPNFLTQLNDYYVRHAVTGEINVRFLDDCVRSHSMWPGTEAFIPTVLKGLEGQDPRALAALCSMFNHYSKPFLALPEALIPVLKARKRLDSQQGTRTDEYYRVCIPASYWLANSRAGIDTLLAEIERHPELVPLTTDVLREVTEQRFTSMPEWRDWWRSARLDFVPRPKKYSWRSL